MSKREFWLRLDVWYVVLTVLYSALVIAGLGFKIDCLDVCTHPPRPNGVWWVDVIGLFVPIGPNNFILLLFPAIAVLKALGPLKLLAVGILVVPFALCHFIEERMRKHQLGMVTKIIANLAILFGLTFIADTAILAPGKSIQILINSLTT